MAKPDYEVGDEVEFVGKAPPNAVMSGIHFCTSIAPMRAFVVCGEHGIDCGLEVQVSNTTLHNKATGWCWTAWRKRHSKEIGEERVKVLDIEREKENDQGVPGRVGPLVRTR